MKNDTQDNLTFIRHKPMSPRVMEVARQAGFELPEVWNNRDSACLEKFASIILEHCSEIVRVLLRDDMVNLTYADATLLQDKIKECLKND
jgi:RNA polymerase-interacting CarD/CdnL/TRCF family regulator